MTRATTELGMMASEMVTSARRAADLVNHLLDFTSLEAGRIELTSAPMAPEAIVQSAVDDLRMSHSDAKILVESVGDVPGVVNGDFPRLRLVLRNLLENAYRYGTPPLRVRITNKNGAGVEIHVEDSGPGVPAQEREAVFERYHRGSTSLGRDGTGIGLYISKGIVELHGGSIHIERSPLGGADFIVDLPAS
jgi:signal transduction histidine kinase